MGLARPLFSDSIPTMKTTQILCAVGLLGALPACKSQRTVLAGPTVTGMEAEGSADNSGRLSNQDPFGYQQNASKGLNAMSAKMFGGKLQSQSEKEFAANKNYLTREFGGQKKFAAKSYQTNPQQRTWTDKLFDTDDNAAGTASFAGANRQAAIKDSPDAAKMAPTRAFADGQRTAATNNYRPAERALEKGRDKPKLTSATPERMTSQEKAVRDRIATSQATASEINKFLGKP